jgi:hypothetical protein
MDAVCGTCSSRRNDRDPFSLSVLLMPNGAVLSLLSCTVKNIHFA